MAFANKKRKYETGEKSTCILEVLGTVNHDDKHTKESTPDNDKCTTEGTTDEIRCDDKCLNLSEELWLQIIQLCFGNRLGSLATDSMFQQLPSVSKYFRQLCICYVQKIPLDFGLDQETIPLIASACRNRVKLASFRALEHEYALSWINAVVHLFKMCNLCELESLDILKIISISNFVDTYAQHQRLDRNIFRGIPYSSMKKKVSDYHYLHSSLANTFYHKKPPLKKLAITIQKNKWPHSLLEIVSETVEELTVDIFHRPDRDDDSDSSEYEDNSYSDEKQFLRYLSLTIENMPKLKKLDLCMWFRNNSSFSIRSKSLQHIDLRRCPPYCKITQYICPSLVTITCCHHGEMSLIKPVIPFRTDELKFQHKDSHGARYELYIACSRLFEGLEVPTNCSIILQM